MVNNKLTLLAASAALVDTALGFNSHRHLHNRNVDKRAYQTDWVTEWVTVWVTPGVENDTPATSSAATTTSTQAVVEAAADNVVSTTTSTVVVAATSTAAEVAADNVVEQPQTTLSTAVKSSSVAVQYTTTSQEAVVVEAAATSTTQAAVVATTSSAAAASSSSSSSSSSTYSGSSGISSKRGIAYNDATLAETFKSSCSNCGWAYNWGAVNDGFSADGVTYIPQLWGPTHSDGWEDNALSAISAGAGAVFSFNEPDISSQAALSVSDAVTGHTTYMKSLVGKALIGAPAVSNSGSTDQGLSYLEQWTKLCDDTDGCEYDFCNVHWYSAAQYSDTLFTHLKSAYEICGKPIWLTEFAPTDTDASTISSFLEDVIPQLDALDYLEAYSYFMVATGNLMTDSTSLSTYGSVYASA